MVLFKLFDIIDVRMADILDILLITIILYYVFLLFRGTRAVQMIFGGLLLILAWLLAQWWELNTLVWFRPVREPSEPPQHLFPQQRP